MFFMVRGAADVAALQAIEQFSGVAVRGDRCMRKHVLASLEDLPQVEASISIGQVSCFEASEFAGLSGADLDALLMPALDRLRRGERRIFPGAGQAVGAIAKGVDFLDREDCLRNVSERILNNESLLILAPRRSGKTSFLHRLMEELAGKMNVVYVDVQRHRTPGSLAVDLLATVGKEPPGKVRRETSGRPWQHVLRTALLSLRGSTRASLFMDELAYFCDNLLKAGGDLLGFLTELGAICAETGVGLVLAGSDDLARFVKREVNAEVCQIGGVFEHLAPLALPPVAEARVGLECRRVLLGMGLVPAAADIDWLVESMDFSMPYAARLLLDAIGVQVDQVGELLRNKLDQTLETFLGHTDAFADIDRHVATVDAPVGEQAVRDLVTDLARIDVRHAGVSERELAARLGAGDPEAGAKALAELFCILPLERVGDNVRLCGRLFRRWWLANEGVAE
jgi:hypothetical protein